MTRVTATLMLLLGAGLLRGQEFRGTISGQVKDATGAVIAGAAVRALQISTNQATSTLTNEDGYYDLPYLQTSDYEIEVSAAGFHKLKKTNVALLVAQKLDLE